MTTLKPEKEIQIDAIKKALGEPFALEFSEYIRKIRNMLMFMGVLSGVIVCNGIKIKDESSVLGLQFSGWDMQTIYTVLFWTILYFMIHFIWLSVDYWNEWNLRLTGTREVYQQDRSTGGLTITADPKQTTLYSWWHENVQLTTNMKKDVEQIEKWFVDFKKTSEKEINSHAYIQRDMIEVVNILSQINNNIRVLEKTMKDQTIPARLEKFDKKFHYFLESQGLRWLMIELLLPPIIGLLAMILLMRVM